MGTFAHCGADKRYLSQSFVLHNQQLERVKLHVNIPKKRKSQVNELLYIDFLIQRNKVLENMCNAYCSVSTHNELAEK